ncbi:alpha/beta hydrolase fold domain-containing protein [Galbitalea sp. SE-J8]|uniref:alpha/beta hydrolase fold domain-containing protein n=1 Tax=Galbitalea sp. SE-J8 TaxID=3054952 RepID=UPI00259D2B62|nr:alpha/beta hydrolase fold domain-containing protein [Galbitalea sp. SE-J8]MDM4761579.1 alpha/beta hydrolase fold domain-containing protein [Galbitalea sp. SE-J8]
MNAHSPGAHPPGGHAAGPHLPGAHLPSSLLPLVGMLTGAKHRYRSAELSRESIEAQLRKPARFAPPPFRDLAVSRADDAGFPVFTVEPQQAPVGTVVYLHGGSYVHEISTFQWKYVGDLARTTGVRAIVPIYPLGPVWTADRTVPAMADLVAASGADVVMGDSAGGGLAVASVLASGRPLPTALIAPWLDLGLTDPALPDLDAVDPWLSPVGLRVNGDAYRGAVPLDDPRVSPLFGDLSRLGPSMVVVGTHDLMLADARAFASRATDAGVAVTLHEEPGMVHVYPLLPIAEAEAARALVRAFVRAHV